MSIWKKYGFAWVTLALLLISLTGHWVFGWFAYLNEQAQHASPVKVSDFLILMMRDTLENWQSEFLQLLWQVVGLTVLMHVGSPQSKESEDRQEAKIDAILRVVDPERCDEVLADISRRYPAK